MLSSKNCTGEAPIITNIMVRKKSANQSQPLSQAISSSPASRNRPSARVAVPAVMPKRVAHVAKPAPKTRSKSKGKNKAV